MHEGDVFPLNVSVAGLGKLGACTAACLASKGHNVIGIDLDEPRIVEGLRITRNVILQMHANAKAARARLVVLLIPTKESAYAHLMKQTRAPDTFAQLVRMESQARADIMKTCAEHSIPCADPLPLMREALARDERLYPMDEDGHPRAGGYALCARAVHDAILRAPGSPPASPPSARTDAAIAK